MTYTRIQALKPSMRTFALVLSCLAVFCGSLYSLRALVSQTYFLAYTDLIVESFFIPSTANGSTTTIMIKNIGLLPAPASKASVSVISPTVYLMNSQIPGVTTTLYIDTPAVPAGRTVFVYDNQTFTARNARYGSLTYRVCANDPASNPIPESNMRNNCKEQGITVPPPASSSSRSSATSSSSSARTSDSGVRMRSSSSLRTVGKLPSSASSSAISVAPAKSPVRAIRERTMEFEKMMTDSSGWDCAQYGDIRAAMEETVASFRSTVDETKVQLKQVKTASQRSSIKKQIVLMEDILRELEETVSDLDAGESEACDGDTDEDPDWSEEADEEYFWNE